MKLDRQTGEPAAEFVSIESLKPWAQNPRTNEHAVESIADSIARFGFGAPIVARRQDSRVIAGHTRLKAAQRLGLEQVPVRFLDLSESEASALALADNKLAELAEWDEEVLHNIINELQDGGVDLTDLGWTGLELEDMLAPEEPELEMGEEDTRDRMPEMPPPVCELGGVYEAGRHVIHCGDCLEVLREIPDNSVDAVVTDPPYGLSAPPLMSEVLQAWLHGEQYEHTSSGFMGADWDSFVPGPRVWREVFRVLKPGGHAVVFAGTRTVDLMGIAVRLAGFELRDCIHWTYWSGFPKSLDVSKAIDKMHGAEREVVGVATGGGFCAGTIANRNSQEGPPKITAPATQDAQRWAGYGTGIKPAVEPALLVRKPIAASSIAANVLEWGTGALNIDGCRFRPGDPMWPGPQDGETSNHSRSPVSALSKGKYGDSKAQGTHQTPGQQLGRFPANLIHVPKASRSEREEGLEEQGLPTMRGHEAVKRKEGSAGLNSPRASAGRTAGEIRNIHPTVKPARLMSWLVRLVSPTANGAPVVLDPFVGSGTTLLGVEELGGRGIGIELEPRHADIALARVKAALEGEP